MKDDISRRRAKAAALVTVIIQLITTFHHIFTETKTHYVYFEKDSPKNIKRCWCIKEEKMKRFKNFKIFETFAVEENL